MVKLLRLPEVVELTGMSGSTIWRREKEGKFPRRRRVGPNAVAWRSDEIQKWVEGRPVAVAVESGDDSGATSAGR